MTKTSVFNKPSNITEEPFEDEPNIEGADLNSLDGETGRVISPEKKPDEVDNILRPRNLTEFVGQKKIKENLSLFIEAAKKRKESLDHCLFSGPPGLGKTSLSHIIATELGSNLQCVSAPAIDKKGDMAAILTNIQPHDVLFIDEIHRLNRQIEEVLYSAMEDFSLDIVIGQGPAARVVKLKLPPFTLVGATTRAGLLTTPLRERFGINLRFEFYDAEDLAKIVKRSGQILNVKLEEDGAYEIAKRSRGTPRIANRLLKRVRDFAEVKSDGVVTCKIANAALDMLEVDSKGLDSMDRKILLTILEKFEGGPVGIDTLSAAIGEERDTIEDVYEPFLIQEGLLQRTPRGRMVTKLAYQHYNLAIPNSEETFI